MFNIDFYTLVGYYLQNNNFFLNINDNNLDEIYNNLELYIDPCPDMVRWGGI